MIKKSEEKQAKITKKIVYKINVLQSLKDKGYNTGTIRNEKLLAEATLTKIRKEELVSWQNMNMICSLLDCDISDVIKCVDVTNEEESQESD